MSKVFCPLTLSLMVLHGCGPTLVDTRTDGAALVESMGDPDVAVAIAATKRVSELFKADGLVDVLDAGRPSARGFAAMELRAYKEPRAVAALLAALDDADAGVRSKVADSLGHVCDPTCVPALRDVAASDPDTFTRQMAAQAIENIDR